MEDRFGQSVVVQIDENILKETNIVKCKKLLSLHQNIRETILETVIIPRYVVVFEECLRKCTVGAMFTITFYKECGLANSDIIKDVMSQMQNVESEVMSNGTLITLLNFYSHSTYICGHSVSSETAGNVNVASESSGELSEDNETDRALYCLAGGTLCEIVKVNKRRVKNLKLSDRQRMQAMHLSQIASNVAMTAEEKGASLPCELRVRDRGFMIFPKATFLPYVRCVNQTTKQYLSKAALQKYGRFVIKVSYFV